jgi:uncharacterized membrane protein (UPF0127 family)
MANSRISRRAAHRAALFFAAVALGVTLAAPIHAEMRVERLWLVTDAGREVPIDIEVAKAPKEKALGLMFRTELADDKGMLFPYDQPRELMMWMHNTYIPLDMVFIRPDGVIHRIEKRAEPLSDRMISSDGPVSAVLEIPGGAADRRGLKAGDRVRHPLFGSAKP